MINAGAQFEGAVRSLGRAVGLSEDAIEKIKATPNLDWAEPPMDASELNDYADAKSKGVPISWKTVHRQARNRGVTDMNYDELDEIAKEQMDNPDREPVVPIDEEAEV